MPRGCFKRTNSGLFKFRCYFSTSPAQAKIAISAEYSGHLLARRDEYDGKIAQGASFGSSQDALQLPKQLLDCARLFMQQKGQG